ncbi:MAG: hypothetical protein JXA21_21125 [Anaerolineae bacterium]|nr:hypothetical protein [Anaerolineae bacterium]
MILAACLWGQKAPERNFDIEELLIEASDLPDGWWEERPPAPPLQVDGEIVASDSIKVIFLANESPREVIDHRVYRFRYTNTADKEYKNQLGIWHSNPALEPPEALPYQSEAAESSVFVCGNISGSESCHFMGVYQEFLVILNINMRGSLNFSGLEKVLKTIDDKMKTHLDL